MAAGEIRISLDVDGNGVAETTWSIPREAKLGNYTVALFQTTDSTKRPETSSRRRESMSWTLGSFRVRSSGSSGEGNHPGTDRATRQGQGSVSRSERSISCRRGRKPPACQMRSEIDPKIVSSFEGFDEFVFGNGPVKEGLLRRGEPLESEEEGGEETRDDRKGMRLPSMDLTLDRSGSIRTTLTHLPEIDTPKEILSELEFRDPNGEIQTVSSKIPLWPSRYLVGIKPDSWAVSKEGLRFTLPWLISWASLSPVPW